MLSICIPCYNYDVNSLVSELIRQSKLLNCPSEIVIIDDCSAPYYKHLNQGLGVKYIELNKNIGRSKIRNKFLEHTRYPYLLFIDCDSLIVQPLFLQNYIQALQFNDEVICGGRIYNNNPPAKKFMLHWKYGITQESKPSDERKQHPHRSFMTNNFLISRKILLQHPFDERIEKYGHEDTLMGYHLKQHNIPIQHINNPVLNGHIEDTFSYLKKTEEAVINLVHILIYVNYSPSFISDVRLLNFYYKIKPLKPLLLLAFKPLQPLIFLLLSKGITSMPLFNFYKLGILAKHITTPHS